ncbi:MAG: family 20 glycosylhydrolase [Armatimonadetes bacterium]|nr:family 20 glycosylhydrolase [Armatimonadota bacterium]
MPRKIWMLDIAREQSPTLSHLYQYASHALESGYDALGLYLEHKFAYECAPWATGKGAVTRDMVISLQCEFPSLQIIPFINLLGHFEGFLYTEEGRQYREEIFTGLQACPSCPEFQKLCHLMLAETMDVFQSDLIHIGGDETYQLAKCDKCQARIPEGTEDPKAWLYAEHFRPLLQQVIDAGRTPGLWGDMYLDHPSALEIVPKETIIFDWQYMNGLGETSTKFSNFRVYGCPTLHVYNAPWMHVSGTEENIRAVAQDVHDLNLEGFCLTQWEGGLFGAYDTQLPAVKWAAQIADNPSNPTSLVDAHDEESGQRTWANIMGVELEKIGGVFKYSKLRNPLKARFLLYSNPFLCWMHHHEQLAGPQGEEAIALCEKALHYAPTDAEKNATIFVRSAIEFVRMADDARKLYAAGDADAAIGKLAPMRYLFENLEKAAKANYDRIGGSMADVYRCRTAKLHVETVIRRIRDYGRRELGYLPAFEVITNPRFMPHDQGCWWLVNKWANE